MNQSRQIRLALLASLLSVFLCAAILAGTAFAWFSDSVSNEGNTLQTGAVMATFAIKQQGASDYLEIQDGTTGVLQTTSWEPGKKETVAFRVTPQTGTLPYTYSIWLKSDAVNPELANYLELYDGNNQPLGTVAEKLNSPVVTGQGGEDNTAAEVSLTIRMKGDAPLSLADQKMDLWFEVRADQPREDVTTAEDLQAQLNAGGFVKLGADIALPSTGPADDVLFAQTHITQDTVLDLNGHTLSITAEGTLPYTPVLISVDEGGTLTINGEGTITSKIGDNGCYGIDVFGGKLIINGGSYYGAPSAVQVTKGSAVINGGTFDLVPDPPYNAAEFLPYLINAVDANYKNGTATIAICGGTFVNFDPSSNSEADGTSYVAKGYKAEAEPKDNGETWYTVVSE